MRIWKSPWGEHIDLDHILGVGPVWFQENMGLVTFAGFNIEFMLRDGPVIRKWDSENLGVDYWDLVEKQRAATAVIASQMMAAVEEKFRSKLLFAWKKEK